MTRPTLYLICGKAGAGKSTLAARLADEGALPIVQDDWMAALFKDELREIADYVRLIPRLQAAMGPHLVALLRHGVSIVLDWPANTRATRQWLADVARRGGADAELHWLDVADAVCLERVLARNDAGTHDFTLTPAQFATLGRYFEAPDVAEGLPIVRHS